MAEPEGVVPVCLGLLVTWIILADEVVFHVAAIVIPLVEISSAQTRKRSRLVVHDYAGLAPTGRLIKIPVPVPWSQWLQTAKVTWWSGTPQYLKEAALPSVQ